MSFAFCICSFRLLVLVWCLLSFICWFSCLVYVFVCLVAYAERLLSYVVCLVSVVSFVVCCLLSLLFDALSLVVGPVLCWFLMSFVVRLSVGCRLSPCFFFFCVCVCVCVVALSLCSVCLICMSYAACLMSYLCVVSFVFLASVFLEVC